MPERSMCREGEAESPGPQGTGQHLNPGQEGPWQHNILGQARPAACSPQPRAPTPTDNRRARRWGLRGWHRQEQGSLPFVGAYPQPPPHLPGALIVGCLALRPFVNWGQHGEFMGP